MSELSRKEEKLISLAEKGGNDASLMLLEMIHELETKIETLATSQETELKKIPNMIPKLPTEIGVEIKGAELITIKGEQGDKPVVGVDFEQPKNGENYILTETDKIEIAGKIEVPIVEKVIEKTEVIREQPIITNEIKEVAVTETAEQIFEKISNPLEEMLNEKLAQIKKELEDKVASSRPIFGSSKTKIFTIDLSSQLNGVLKTFFIGTHFGIISVDASSAPFGAFRPTVDYTESGRNIVFDAAIDAAVSLAQGQSLIVRYLK